MGWTTKTRKWCRPLFCSQGITIAFFITIVLGAFVGIVHPRTTRQISFCTLRSVAALLPHAWHYHTGDQIKTPPDTNFRAGFLRNMPREGSTQQKWRRWKYLVEIYFHRRVARRLHSPSCRENQLWNSYEGVRHLKGVCLRYFSRQSALIFQVAFTTKCARTISLPRGIGG